MINQLKSSMRSWARQHVLTSNTLRYRIEFARVLEVFQHIGRQGKVFDGGAGSGEMLRRVYRAGMCVEGIGLEPDPELFAILEKNLSDCEGLSGVNGSLLEVPMEDGVVDCAMSTQVLEHIVEHEKAAAELGRVVKPGGYVVVSVPHPPEPFPNPGHVREGYTEEDLKALFPPPDYKHLMTRYFFTRPTLERLNKAQNMPLKGRFLPVGWADCESRLTDAERAEQLPYGIICAFQKAGKKAL